MVVLTPVVNTEHLYHIMKDPYSSSSGLAHNKYVCGMWRWSRHLRRFTECAVYRG